MPASGWSISGLAPLNTLADAPSAVTSCVTASRVTGIDRTALALPS
jgi:hypothetical protein